LAEASEASTKKEVAGAPRERLLVASVTGAPLPPALFGRAHKERAKRRGRWRAAAARVGSRSRAAAARFARTKEGGRWRAAAASSCCARFASDTITKLLKRPGAQDGGLFDQGYNKYKALSGAMRLPESLMTHEQIEMRNKRPKKSVRVFPIVRITVIERFDNFDKEDWDLEKDEPCVSPMKKTDM
jgi:hypothetical protein